MLRNSRKQSLLKTLISTLQHSMDEQKLQMDDIQGKLDKLINLQERIDQHDS